jgi:hypothetical protein
VQAFGLPHSVRNASIGAVREVAAMVRDELRLAVPVKAAARMGMPR